MRCRALAGIEEAEELEAENLVRFGVGHLAALALIAAQALAGYALLLRTGLARDLGTLERFGFGWATGFTLSVMLLLALAGAGVLGAGSSLLVFALLVLLSPRAVRDVGAQLAAGWRRATRTGASATAIGIASLGLAPLAALFLWPLCLQTLLPNSDWDSALYHLPLAERYLAGSLFGHDPYFPAFSFPGAVNLLYAALLSLGIEAAIVPLNFYAALLTLASTFAFGCHLGGRTTGFFSALVLASIPLFWQLGVDPRIDGFLALCILLAFHALYRMALLRDDRSLYLLGLSLGAALGCKYTAVFFASGLLAIALLLLVGRRERTGEPLPSKRRLDARRVRLFCACLALVLLPNGSWYAANFAIHGDPLYPMIRGSYSLADDGTVIREPSQREAISLSQLEAPAVRRSLESLDRTPPAAPPTNLFDLPRMLVHPENYAVKPNHGVGPLPFLSLLLPLCVWLFPRKTGSARTAVLVVWGTAWTCYVVLGSQTNLLRYVLPVFPVLSALAGLSIASVPLRSVRALVALVGALLLFSSHHAEVARLSVLRVDDGLALRGAGLAGWDRSARNHWLSEVGYNFTPAMAIATQEINAFIRSGRMQREDLILMVGEGKGHLLDCAYLPDGSWFAHRFVAELANAGLDYDALARRLRSRGVTHLLYNSGYFADWVVPMTDTARSRVAFAVAHVEQFVAREGRVIFSGPGIVLAEIRERKRNEAEAP